MASYSENGVDGDRPKRKYEKPRILAREMIEAMASTCAGPGGKSNPIDCPSGPIQS